MELKKAIANLVAARKSGNKTQIAKAESDFALAKKVSAISPQKKLEDAIFSRFNF